MSVKTTKTDQKTKKYMREYMRKYRANKVNNDKDKTRKREKVHCEGCGSQFSRGYMYQHKKTCSILMKEKKYSIKEINDMSKQEFLCFISQVKRHAISV